MNIYDEYFQNEYTIHSCLSAEIRNKKGHSYKDRKRSDVTRHATTMASALVRVDLCCSFSTYPSDLGQVIYSLLASFSSAVKWE